MKGVYALIVEAHGFAEVGRLGRQKFDGTYIYVGSALGPAGLKRIERHWRVANGYNKTRHWHIDYLLSLGELKGVLFCESAEKKLECALAKQFAKMAATAEEHREEGGELRLSNTAPHCSIQKGADAFRRR